jgi:hypothetical protein
MTSPAVWGSWRSVRNGRHENAKERREDFVRLYSCPTQAKIGLEWATSFLEAANEVRSKLIALAVPTFTLAVAFRPLDAENNSALSG